MTKTVAEINERIARREAVVMTAEEIIGCVAQEGFEEAARKVDVVTTGTFGTMCSSGMFMNIGHSKPRIKLGGGKTTLNDVPAYAGVAAVDLFWELQLFPMMTRGTSSTRASSGMAAATSSRIWWREKTSGLKPRPMERIATPARSSRPGSVWPTSTAPRCSTCATLPELRCRGECKRQGDIHLHGCSKARVRERELLIRRCASPLLNDPDYRTIGIGTKVFLGGGIGYVAWQGTQHNPHVARLDNDVPRGPSGTLALIGDLKQMSPRWLVGTSMLGYGPSLTVGVGVPIPILTDAILRHTLVTDADIVAPVIDYSSAQPNREPDTLGEVTYAELMSGRIMLQGREIPTASLSSRSRAREIALTLKSWITAGDFLLTTPVAPLPGPDSNVGYHHLIERPLGD